MTNEKLSVNAVLAGFEIAALPTNYSPLECVFVIKCLDDDGRASWALRFTDGINNEELLGVLTIQRDLLRKDILAEWDGERD